MANFVTNNQLEEDDLENKQIDATIAGFLGLEDLGQDVALEEASRRGIQLRRELQAFPVFWRLVKRVADEHPELGLKNKSRECLESFRTKDFPKGLSLLAEIAQEVRPYAKD